MSDIITQTSIGGYEIFSGFPSHFLDTKMTCVVFNNKVMLVAYYYPSNKVSFSRIHAVRDNPRAYGGRGSYTESDATGKYTLQTYLNKYEARDNIMLSMPLTKAEASQIVPKQIIEYLSKNKKVYLSEYRRKGGN